MELPDECISDLSKDGFDWIALKATFPRSERSELGILHPFWPFKPWKNTLRTIQPNPSQEKKLLKRFSEIGTFKEKLTPTDGRMTDKSVLEKLRCQMAQRS
jgi:hypothetical protein